MERKDRNRITSYNLITKLVSQFATLGISQIKIAITNFLSLFFFIIVLFFSVIYIGIPSLGSIFNSLSPWNQQKQEIVPRRHKSKNIPLNVKLKTRELSFEPFKSINIYKQIKL